MLRHVRVLLFLVLHEHLHRLEPRLFDRRILALPGEAMGPRLRTAEAGQVVGEAKRALVGHDNVLIDLFKENSTPVPIAVRLFGDRAVFDVLLELRGLVRLGRASHLYVVLALIILSK